MKQKKEEFTVMKKCFSILFAALLSAAFAEQQIKPDANTLWRETGKNIQLGKGWGRTWANVGKTVEIQSLSDGSGFCFNGKDGSGRKTLTSVPVTKEFPYLVAQVTDVDVYKGFVCWTLQIPEILTVSSVKPEKGIYVFNLFPEGKDKLNKKGKIIKDAYIVWYLYNTKLTFSDMRLVKTPDFAVDAVCDSGTINIGSKIKFTVKMKDEAEDVSIRLFTTYLIKPVQINGGTKIQLKPVDKTQKIWSAEVEVKSLNGGKPFKPGSIFMKTAVLGGEIDVPVWSNFAPGFSGK